jgi:hypothetical protein
LDGLLVTLSKQATEEARGMRRLLPLLLQLLLELIKLSLGLLQRDVLDEDGLRQHIQGIRIAGKPLVEQRLGIRILPLKRGLI